MRKVILFAALFLGLGTSAFAQHATTDSTSFCKEKVTQLFRRDSLRNAAIDLAFKRIKLKYTELSEEQFELRLNKLAVFVNLMINNDDPYGPFPAFTIRRGSSKGPFTFDFQ